MRVIQTTGLVLLAALLVVACSQEPAPTIEETAVPTQSEAPSSDAARSTPAPSEPPASDVLVPFETFTLENGLKTIFHIDRSDPVVAVVLTAHVGSAREKTGRTGFAHLFEHLLFLESENLGKGGLDKMSARIGGSGANGSTSRDRTNYFQTVPKDALEKMIWAEADKIGFFINTVTDPVLAKEKQVVKNEKRQNYDNVPYGHTGYVITKNLYPAGHEYSWEVIGSLEDVQKATLDDVREFFRRWYVPNNVTLTVAGDFDVEQAKAWVEKYFGEIPRGPDITRLEKRPAGLQKTKRLYHEDNFAVLPELHMVWPTVPRYSQDSYALAVLTDLLSDGKTAPLNVALIDEKKLTAQVNMGGYESELAGQMELSVRAFADTDLDAVKATIDEALQGFEAAGVAPKDLQRVKTKQEVAFFGGLQTVLGKAFGLAQYDIFAADPGYIEQDIKNIRAVTAEDVMRVYRTYIKDQPLVMTSFVPKGSPDLALEGSTRADIVEEPIVQGAEETFDASVGADYERTPSAFDRTVEPPYGDAPTLPGLNIWEEALQNGLRVLGLEDTELPLVSFSLSIEGGHWVDPFDKVGRANLVAELMTKGTATKTTAELEEALDLLGAEIAVNARDETLTFSGETLARNFDAVIELLGEMILTPRWDEEEFELAKARVLTTVQARQVDPASIAGDAFAFALYGDDHILGRNLLGSVGTLETLSLDDLKAYYDAQIIPNLATFHVAGALSKAKALNALTDLAAGWPSKRTALPDYPMPEKPESSKVYFYDVPGAKQSYLFFGYPALKRTDERFYPATVMNYILGGGGFASRLMQELRETKGYTYGVFSRFQGSARGGEFLAASGVRSNVTLEAADLIKTIMTDYADTFTDADLEVTKSFLTKSKAREFESLNAKLGVLIRISRFDLPYDYPVRETEIVEAMTKEKLQELARELIRPDRMHYVVVGDAETQSGRLTELGFGNPVLLNDALKAVRP